MDDVFKLQYRRDRDVLQIQMDAILVAVEANRTIVDAMVADDASLADQVDLLRTAAILDRPQVDLLLRMMSNRPFNSGALVIGTNKAKIKIGVAVNYMNQELLKLKAITDDAFTLSGTTVNTGNSTAEKCRWLLTLQANGTPVATQGTIVASASTSVLPVVPANETPIGAFQIVTDASNDFIPGSTEFDATGMTASYENFSWPDNGTDAIAALGAHGIAAALGAIEETALGATGESAIGAMPPF